MDKELMEDKLCQLIDQFKQNTPSNFYLLLLNKIHPFHDESGRTKKILCQQNTESKNRKV